MLQSKKVGVIVEVDGSISKVGMYNETNDSEYIWSGNVLVGPKVGAYLTINQNDVKIIATVYSEKLLDEQNDIREHEYNNTYAKNTIKRIICLKVKGVIKDNSFYVTSKYVPMIGNVVTLTSLDELNLIYGIHKNEKSIEIGTSILEGYKIKIPLNSFFASHIGIFGNTGSGKSNTLHKLYTELFRTVELDSMKKHSQFFVIDFNGEYTQDKQFSLQEGSKKVFNISTKDTDSENRIPILKKYLLNADILAILFDAKPGTQVPFLRNALRTYNEGICDSAEQFAKLEIGLLRSILLKYKSVNATSLDDWIDVCEKMKCAPEYLDNLKSLKHYSHYGNQIAEESETGIKIIENEQLTSYGEEYLKLQALEQELRELFNAATDFQKLAYFLDFQRIYVSAWKSTNLEHINPLFKRMENSIKSLEKVVKIVDDIKGEYSFMNIISLVNADDETSRLIPMLFAKMIYDEHRSLVTTQNRVNETRHLVIDEAHNILNDQFKRNSDDWQDYRLSVFEQIIKEGRKFGFFMTISSQRPSDISPTIMSQLHNYIIHRLVNENDLSMLLSTMPTLDKFSYQMIPSLGQGEAVITGNAINVPVLVKINKEEIIRPKSDDIILTELWNS